MHFLGCGAEDSADLSDLAALESLAAPPALLVWQGVSHAPGMHERHERHEGLEGQEAQGAIGIHRRFALAATQRGFTVVALAAPPGEALAIDFVLALYRSLAQGAAIDARNLEGATALFQAAGNERQATVALRNARLFDETQQTLATALGLLGVSAPEDM